MKTLLKIFAVLALLNVSAMVVPQKASAQVGVSFQLFYDQLSPYGSWVDYPNHGYVWIPSAGPGFSPYATAGHWVFTSYGWTWASDYSWGWAPFHYGRWLFDPIYGWIWVPDTIWGPAWVVWRSSPGYYGWAPLRPGISISIATGGYSCPNDWWVFVPGRYITSPVVYQYYAPRSNNVTIINNTTIINKTYTDNERRATYIYGPERESVQKVTGKTIQPVAIKDNDRPGQSLNNNELKIYRPHVQKADAADVRPAPRKVSNLKEVKPVAQRSDVSEPNVKSSGTQGKPSPTREVTPEKKQPSPAQKTGPQDEKKKQQPQPRKPNPKESSIEHPQSGQAYALSNNNTKVNSPELRENKKESDQQQIRAPAKKEVRGNIKRR